MTLKIDIERWTHEDLRNLPDDGNRYEVIDGELYMTPAPHLLLHQRVVGNLYRMIADYVELHDLGKAFAAPADVVLREDRVVQPDIFFISNERMHLAGAVMEGAPDLIVEVLSPATEKYDRTVKFRLYEEEGVREYWLVDPSARTIDVFARQDERFQPVGHFSAGTRVHSRLLSNFTCEVSTVLES